jgi:hypothetical protein
MWVTSLSDPDGYRLDFESDTDAPEDTEFFRRLRPGGWQLYIYDMRTGNGRQYQSG